MVADHWLSRGAVPSMAAISDAESLVGPPNIAGDFLPLDIVPVER